MTIAAGFLSRDGALLCADTLLTGADFSSHQSKIGGYRFRDGAVMFALAGHVDMAEAAIQQCEEDLFSYSGKPRSRRRLAEQIRRVLASEYKTHIAENGWEASDYDYQFIIAIQSDVDGVDLYCTSQTQMKRSRQGFEIIGSGDPIGRLAVQRFCDPRTIREMSGQRTAIMAAYAIGEAKRYHEGTVGGNSVIIQLERDGRVVTEFGINTHLIEKYAIRLQQYSNELLSAFFNLGTNEHFRIACKSHPSAIERLREEYRRELDASTDMGPIETLDVMWEMNPRMYMSKKRAMELAPRGPQSPTADP
ncbi:MAG: hypothetical protein ABSF98_04755 [Bryobacteraceae bacterium]